MKASEVASRFAPFGALINKHALSDNYKALLLTPTSVRAMSAYGAMETELALGVDSEVAIEGDAFLQILRSLPVAEFELGASDGVIKWKCGVATGRLAVMGSKVNIPSPPWPEDLRPVEVASDFALGLDLGGMACGTTALLSVGLYGIIVTNVEGNLTAYASDNTTMSRAVLGPNIPGAPEAFTITPDAARLIGMVSQRGKAAFMFDDTTLWLQTPDTKLVIKQSPAIKVDLRGIADSYLGDKIKLDLNRDVISAFIRRAEALTEERGKAGVKMSVKDGAVRLSFEESRAAQEEYYLAEGGPKVDVDEIEVDARRLGRALSHSGHIVFDYAKRGALVLRGGAGFAFIISAKAREDKAE